MGDTIRIQMMNTFTIYINEIQADHMVNKSRKGVALMQYLILNREQPVPNQRLLAEHIIGGYDLGLDYPELTGGWLIACG